MTGLSGPDGDDVRSFAAQHVCDPHEAHPSQAGPAGTGDRRSLIDGSCSDGVLVEALTCGDMPDVPENPCPDARSSGATEITQLVLIDHSAGCRVGDPPGVSPPRSGPGVGRDQAVPELVDARTTSSGRNTYSARGAGSAADLVEQRPDRRAAHAVTAWRTVVSGGSVKAISSESSYPTIDTSPGHGEPERRGPRGSRRAPSGPSRRSRRCSRRRRAAPPRPRRPRR